MAIRSTVNALMLSVITIIGAHGMANAASAFDAQDSIAVLGTKAAHLFVGRSLVDIKEALGRAAYRDVMVIELNTIIAPGASLVEEGVALASEDVHVVVTLESASGFAISSPRVSFFLRMKHGVCSEVLTARKFTK